MAAIPDDWTIAVNGAWNLAILTPNGIARRMLDLEIGTPVEVQVALDYPGMIRVQHEGLLITPTAGRIVTAPIGELNPTTLTKAARAAIRALENLPITPVSASGVNIRYKFDQLSDRFMTALRSDFDDQLADGGRTITARKLQRRVTWKEGVVNIELDEHPDGQGTLQLNFHRDSATNTDHIAWLGLTNEMCADAQVIASLVD